MKRIAITRVYKLYVLCHGITQDNGELSTSKCEVCTANDVPQNHYDTYKQFKHKVSLGICK